MNDPHLSRGRVLIIAGSDSGGGAGIQADIKTVTALGGYAASAITALTAQNTLGVHGIHDVPVDFIRQQIGVVLEDIGADAIKTGMLHTAEVIEAVAEELDAWASDIPVVVDPVMRAKGGAALLEDSAAAALVDKLVPRASVLTPNIPEAEALTGIGISSDEDMCTAGEKLIAMGAEAVLVKGGHLIGDELVDILVTDDGIESFKSQRIRTRHTHGTGCTLASAIAVSLSQGYELTVAVQRARAYVQQAIRTAPGFGGGHGPLNHGHTVSES